MNRKRYNYINRLVEKITTSPCYSGETADFSFDYWTKELDIGYTESDRLFDVIVQAFQRIYGKRNVSIITDEEENFD